MNKGFTLIRTIRKNLVNVQQGFTLIELLVVITIIGILIGLSIFGLQGARKSARDAQRKTDLEEIRSGLEIYRADCSDYPVTSALVFGGSLSGDDSSTNCSSSTTYISLVPNDPLYDASIPTSPSYTYNKSGVGKYTLCATLEQSVAAWCVKNP